MASAGNVSERFILTLNSLKINLLKLTNISCRHLQSNLQYLMASSLNDHTLPANSNLSNKYSLIETPVQY
jgi:hypothetical protein